jgi:DME family drug/metabolite transporter
VPPSRLGRSRPISPSLSARGGSAGRWAVASGLLLIGLAAAAWGTTGTTQRIIGGAGAVPLLVGASRLAVSAPLLAASLHLRGGRLSWPGWRAVAAGGCMALYQVCYFSAVPLAGVGPTALLAICSAPVLVSIMAGLVLRERMTRSQVLALAGGVGGAALLVAGAGRGTSLHFGAGALLALGAGLSYALFVVLAKVSLAGARPLELTTRIFSIAALALLPTFLILPGPAISLWQRDWPWLLYLGAIPTAGAYWIYARGLSRTPATAAAVVTLVEPFTATLLGIVLFAERLGPLSGLGALLLIAAVAGLAISNGRRPEEQPRPQHDLPRE